MAWGILEPMSFGAFFPLGDYPEWEDKIKDYFDHGMTAERRAYFENSHRQYIYEICTNFTKEYGLVESHEWPSKYKMAKMHALNSLLILRNRLCVVKEDLKDLVEMFEPGVHAFSPIEIVSARGEPHPDRFFCMLIRQFVDSFRPDLSAEWAWDQTGQRYRASRDRKKEMSELALSSDAIGHKHLWRELSLRLPQMFISDELRQAISERGIKIPPHFQLKSV